jgi:AcrR family transcriptional regulator
VTTPAAETSSSPRRRPRDRKEQILTAARDLFVEKGFPAVSMVMVADAVGITSGALYRHFQNKAVLLERVFDESFAWLDTPLAQRDYEGAVEELIALVVDRPYLSDLWTHETRYLSDEKRRALRRRLRDWSAALTPALRSRRPDLDPGELELLVWSFYSLISCLGRQALHSPLAIRVPAVRSGLRALISAQLTPGGTTVEPRLQTLLPVSIRERLLLAAFEQFSEHGFQDTSMASLGAAVDVTGPNIYGYYQSKTDLARAVFDRNTHALWLDLDFALATSDTADEAIRKLAHRYVALARYWASSVEEPSDEENLAPVIAVRREYLAEWVNLLMQAVPSLGQRDARLKVQLGLNLVADLYSTAKLSRVDTFQENVATLVLGILFD